jgi:hypothetical protein
MQKLGMYGGLTLASLMSCTLWLTGCAGHQQTTIAVNATRAPVSQQERIPNHKNIITFYALGDWGTGEASQEAVAKALQVDIVRSFPEGNERDVPPFVLGLGDNFYQFGLPDQQWKDVPRIADVSCHDVHEEDVQCYIYQKFGKIYQDVKYGPKQVDFHVVPGNHDYGRALPKDRLPYKGGNIIHQETTAESMYNWFKYYPIQHENIPLFRIKERKGPHKSGIADTNDRKEYEDLNGQDKYEIALPQKLDVPGLQDIIIVALDTQIILDLYDEEDKREIYEKYVGELFEAEAYRKRLEALLAEDAKWKIVIGHHPLKSFGSHGYRGRSFLGRIVTEITEQDLRDDAYQRFIKDFTTLMKKHQVNFYLAGHDHNIQFLDLGNSLYQFISGSASIMSDIAILDQEYYFTLGNELGFIRFDIDKTEQNTWIKIFGVTQATQDVSLPILRAIFKITPEKKVLRMVP